MNYRAIYQVLITYAGARADDMDSFLRAHDPTQQYPTNEYRFQGSLGFGGKYYRGNRVACYPEDLTPEREATIAKVNSLLKDIGAGMIEALKASTELVARMSWMTPEQRLQILGLFTDEFCVHCGGKAGCHCQNDE